VFKRIMVPVDLAHPDTQAHALRVAGDLASHYAAAVTYVSVTAETPGKLAHNPTEFREKLAAFAAAEAESHGIATDAHTEISHDPTTDLDACLLRAVEATGADLVVMASHIPGLADYIWPSNGGKIAGHAKVSVMVVRD